MKKSYPITQIKGVIPAMFTTFDENEEVDLKRAKVLTEYLVETGVHGLYITGSTGEGFLMTGEERMRFAETVVHAVDGRLPVIVHVGDIGTKKTIELAQHAQRIGADAISSVPPFYYQFSNDDIYQYYKDVSNSVDIPMIVYNIKLAGFMNNNLFKKIATIENVKGLKFTGREHDDMCALKQELGPDFMIYSGCDEMATQGLLAGADGIIGSFYNMLPDTFLAMYDLTQSGKYIEAFEIQKVASELIHYFVQWDFFPIMKQCMRDSGIDVGYSRRPFLPPTAETMATIWKFCNKLHAKHSDIPMAFIGKK